MTGSDSGGVRTARLLVRPPVEADRERFAELFRDPDFMVFYPEVLAGPCWPRFSGPGTGSCWPSSPPTTGPRRT